MKKLGFDNDKYIAMQSERILERINSFGGKLYLEFGGKLFDDYHAARVLPGFMPDSKLRMLESLKDRAEIVLVISANDIEKNKQRGDLGITYDLEALRLIDAFRSIGLFVGSVVITQFESQPNAEAFRKKLEALGIKVYKHYTIPNYPSDIPFIVSDEGLGKNEYIETTRELVVITAPGPGSGKMATCLSQLYHDQKRGIRAGYAKFETFPIWSLPLSHPVNMAYEAATANIDDVNMIDHYHLEAYGKSAVNYNRDIDIFPVLNAMFEKIYGSSPYKSPTDMGVNMAGFCITDDEACRQASYDEIIRRYFAAKCAVRQGQSDGKDVYKIEILMSKIGISTDDRKCVKYAREKGEETDAACRRQDRNGKNDRPPRRRFGALTQRAQASRRYSRGNSAHTARGHRTHTPSQGNAHGQQKPPYAHGRASHSAFHMRQYRRKRGGGDRTARQPQKRGSSFHGTPRES